MRKKKDTKQKAGTLNRGTAREMALQAARIAAEANKNKIKVRIDRRTEILVSPENLHLYE